MNVYYSKEGRIFDIALIKLKKPLQLNSRVAIVRLPKSNRKPNGNVEVAGWGRINSHRRIHPGILQRVDLRVIDDHICENAVNEKFQEKYGPELPEFSLHKSSFCAFGPMTGGKGACQVSSLY